MTLKENKGDVHISQASKLVFILFIQPPQFLSIATILQLLLFASAQFAIHFFLAEARMAA
jgi:hypothetical protein